LSFQSIWYTFIPNLKIMIKKLQTILLLLVLVFSTNTVLAQCSASSTVSTCNNNGTVTLDYTGGAPDPYTYTVVSGPGAFANPGPATSAATSFTWNGCDPGTYTVEIANAGGSLCTATVVVPGTYADPTAYSPIGTGATTCINNPNGEIHGVLADGLAPYTYEIISGPSGVGSTNSTGDFLGLLPGNYVVRAYDACGNFVTQNVAIANFSFAVSAPVITSTSCTGFTLDNLTVTPLPAGGAYTVKQGATVLATGSALPLAFTSTKADVNGGAISICYTDACGNDVCTPSAGFVNDWNFTDAPYTVACPGGVTITSLTTTGTITAPYTAVVSYTAPTGLPNETIPGNTTPYALTGVTGSENPIIYTVTITDACGATKTIQKDLTFTTAPDAYPYNGCNATDLSMYVNANGTAPISYSIAPDPNAANPSATGDFLALPDGNYTVVATDACGKTTSYNILFDRSWQTYGGVQNSCKYDTLQTYVYINGKSAGNVVVTQYDGPISTLATNPIISTQTYTGGANNNSQANLSVATVYFENTIPNQVTTYILVDACGLADTVEITNPAIGHQPLVHSAKVTPKCINKGDILVSTKSDAAPECIYASIANINTPTTIINGPALTGCGTAQVTDYVLAVDLPVGTYIITYTSGLGCPNSTFYDTVVVPPYVFPKIRSGLFFSCGAGSSNIVVTGKSGLKPYQYRIISTVPSGTTYATPFQSSNIFAIPSSTETLISVQLVDACGNTVTRQLPLKPVTTPIIKTSTNPLNGCNLPLDFKLYIDSAFYPDNTVYEWTKTAGAGSGPTILSTTAAINLQLPTDIGTYSCHITIPGTCYDKTAVKIVPPAVLNCLNEIGNYVWNDIDKDGVQDSTEVGVAGVTVTLYDAAGAILATTKTDAYGYYLFTALPDGDYSVGFTAPANYIFTQSNTPGDNADNTNSDADPMTGKTTAFTLQGGESDLTADAGIYQPLPVLASLGNYVWNDVDKDGIQDATEVGVAGVSVTLYDAAGLPIATTITDASGHYQFTDLTPGTYSVGFTLPPTYVFTGQDATGAATNANNPADFTDSDVNPSTGMTTTVTLVGGENNPGLDAGIYLQAPGTAALGNKVWYDVDNDGIQDPNEAGVPGVTVTLYAADGVTVVSTTTTDALGNYMFNNLTPAGYVVGFTNLPAGYSISPDSTTSSANDSDPDAATGKTGVITLGANEVNLTIDAGIHNPALPTGGLGTTVWFDRNNDGIQDADENGVPGVTVILYDNAGTPIGSTVTDNMGNYAFNNLADGNYSVGFENIPAGYTFTGTDNGANDATDSDPDGLGRTTTVPVTAGGFNPIVDGGIVLNAGTNATASLGDRVWNDENNNGIQDPGEVGVAGVTVTLYGPDGTTVIATTTTDALGNYIFTGLPQGDYVVGFSNIPAGYTFSAANQGSDPALDANADASTGGKSGVIHLSTGEENLTIDAGIHAAPGLASCGDYVWIDQNQDGIQDPSEIGIAGVSVTLYDAAGLPIANTTTDANGLYQFTGLNPGTYSVGFSNFPNGYQITTMDATGDVTNTNGAAGFTDSDVDPATGMTAQFTLAVGENNPGIDAGVYTDKAALGNYVWSDLDNDGIQDAGEPGIAGVTVNLYDDAGNLISSTVTDAAGHYQFINLEPGDYQVGFTGIPAGSTFSPQMQGGDIALDSDVNPGTGLSGIITLDAGDNNQTIDAGVHTPSTAGLGNYVWIDANQDGQQDASEAGLGGVTVTLYDALGVAIKSTVTDERGFYTFADLAPGTYSVGFSNFPTVYGGPTGTSPQTLVPTLLNTGADATDSDMDPSTFMTAQYTIVAGEYNPTVDAGVYFTAPLSLLVTSFTANATAECSAILTWNTTNSSSIKNFSLLRSVNGDFTTIAKVNATANTQYSFIDNELNSGSYQYKVQVYELNGNTTETEVKAVNIDCNTTVLTISPNPTTDNISITVNSAVEANYSIKLMDMVGKTLINKNVKVNTNANVITLSLSALPSGIYNLVLNTGSITNTYRITKN
jgi:protocatechuate 3,4-dioxygenase beta subunit